MENILSGCPVLFEQSGLIFTLKPCGKITKEKETGGDAEPTPAATDAALVQTDAGELTLKVVMYNKK